ncbi:MAG: hypothetical protein RMK18_04925 [Armatimonadota bacterium]|nr:hypothetical protein [Armatimonadota bacterium]MCX7777147.1 hypothetical protein [Armatimonadota bacterium]MDW8025194.1 hypothetical protein [Armatimonadota bacterium]
MRRGEVVETVIIFIAIGSIWLLTLGYTSAFTTGFCITIIVALCIIAVRRWRRFKAALEEERKRIEMMGGFYDYPPQQQRDSENGDGKNI